MFAHSLALCVFTVLQAATVDGEAEHDANPVFRSLRVEGFSLAGAVVPFPEPILRDDQSDETRRAALVLMAGSATKLKDMQRDSPTAPIAFRSAERKGTNGVLVQTIDLYFFVRADLDAIEAASRPTSAWEAAKLRFTLQVLGPIERFARKLPAARPGGKGRIQEWHVHTIGRLMDRVRVETTTRVTSSRTAGSIVFAARTDRDFDKDELYPNLWRKLFKNTSGARTALGPVQPYPGGNGYMKFSRIPASPGILLVEARVAFVTPRAWFDEAPSLRTKFSPFANELARTIRTQLSGGKS